MFWSPVRKTILRYNSREDENGCPVSSYTGVCAHGYARQADGLASFFELLLTFTINFAPQSKFTRYRPSRA